MPKRPILLSLRRLCQAAFLCTGLVIMLAGGLVLLDHSYPLPKLKRSDYSIVIRDSDGRPIHFFLNEAGRWRHPVESTSVDKKFLAALVAIEDQRYYSHFGIDFLAGGRAVWQMVSSGRVVSGASTLTMQTAKLLEPRPRTLVSKAKEALRALQLEWHLEKEDILSIYLTLAPYGGNLEGIQAASWGYFGKEPRELTWGQVAMLVALPQSPERLRPDRYPYAARAARDRILDRLRSKGVITALEAEEAKAETIVTLRQPTPRLAPHFARRLKARLPHEVDIPSNLDRDLQVRLEAVIRQHQTDLETGATIAALVVENQSHAIRAYVGASDFFDTRQLGQNDMVRAIRSPGSTLKPFIYALAFEDLILHPETVITDQPTVFGRSGYMPKNFDKRFHGQISAAEALRMSLNVPAVAILERLGPERFAAILKKSGATLVLPASQSRFRLPIALGGVGTNLESLVTLYSGLANGGSMYPLQDHVPTLQSDETPLSKPQQDEAYRFVNSRSASMVSVILREAPAPYGAISPMHLAKERGFSFKTGTSYGFRDAWAIGYDQDYTIGIWVGRPDGGYSPERLGINSAAPLLFQVFGILPSARTQVAGIGTSSSDVAPSFFALNKSGQMPKVLRAFDAAGPVKQVQSNGLKGPQIAYPVDQTTLILSHQSGDLRPLVVEVTGGQFPLTWLFNGQPVAGHPLKRRFQWRPDSLGQTRITVIDKQGRSSSVEVWIE